MIKIPFHEYSEIVNAPVNPRINPDFADIKNIKGNPITVTPSNHTKKISDTPVAKVFLNMPF